MGAESSRPFETDRVEFPNPDGELLAARFERPVEGQRACALFAHCFTCSKDIAAASRLSRALTRDGFAVLRFDFTGLGGSEGDFANTNFSSNVEDLVAAAAWLAREHQPPSLLVGHSFGGAAVLAAAPRIASVRAVATIAAPADPNHLAELLRSTASEIEARGVGTVVLGGRAFTIKRQLLEDLDSQSLTSAIRAPGRRALLVCHAPDDGVVGIDHARRIFDAAPHPKSFLSLDDADHLLSRKEDSRWLADVLAAWASRYVR